MNLGETHDHGDGIKTTRYAHGYESRFIAKDGSIWCREGDTLSAAHLLMKVALNKFKVE